MVGAAWSPSYVLYTQDFAWKVSGDITRVSMFYGQKEGCVKGIKTQYGPDPANAHRLGLEVDQLLESTLHLQPGERFVAAEYKPTQR